MSIAGQLHGSARFGRAVGIAGSRVHSNSVRARAKANSPRWQLPADDLACRAQPEGLLRLGTQLEPYSWMVGKPAGRYLSAVFTRDGKEIITGDSEGKLAGWDALSGKELRTSQLPGKAIGALALAPNGADLLVASWRSDPQGKNSDVMIKRAQRATFREAGSVDGHKGQVTALVFSPNGQSFLSSSLDGTVLWWGLETKGKVQSLVVPGAPVTALAYLGYDRALTAGTDNAIRLWQLMGAKELQRFDGHQAAINTLAIAPNKNVLLSASNDRSARLWRLPVETVSDRPQPKAVGGGMILKK